MSSEIFQALSFSLQLDFSYFVLYYTHYTKNAEIFKQLNTYRTELLDEMDITDSQLEWRFKTIGLDQRIYAL